MKRKLAIIPAFLLLFALSACGRTIYPDMPADAPAFSTGEYIDENDDDAGYLTVEYNGRTYMPYGTLGKSLCAEDIDACIGYEITDRGDKDTRLFTLTADREHNYLMVHYVATNLMNPPTFFRAVDTRGKEIETPDYIENLDYTYWN